MEFNLRTRSIGGLLAQMSPNVQLSLWNVFFESIILPLLLGCMCTSNSRMLYNSSDACMTSA